MLLNKNGMNLIKPHPYKQIGRRLFSMLALLNLCFWSLVAACNFLFNLKFENGLYDLCLFFVFMVIHIAFLYKIIEKLHCLPYKNIILTFKGELTYAFVIKLLAILLLIFITAFVTTSAIAFGIAYATYTLNNQRITELAFVLNSWNLVYLFAIISTYAACLITTKISLIKKFNVHNITDEWWKKRGL